jgi:hypothetical protein
MHTPDQRDLGKRISVHANGLSIGTSEDDVEVKGAAATGTRLELHCAAPSEQTEWQVKARGRVRVNSEFTSQRRLEHGDDLRIVDTFFRFLSDSRGDQSYHEAIYHLTILDTPTRLPNRRYLLELLCKELERAQRYSRPLTVATLCSDVEDDSHDLMRAIGALLRDGDEHVYPGAGKRLVGRLADRELALVCPDARPEQVREELAQRLGTFAPRLRIGLAQAGPGLVAGSLIEAARGAGAE